MSKKLIKLSQEEMIKVLGYRKGEVEKVGQLATNEFMVHFTNGNKIRHNTNSRYIIK